MSLKTGDRRCGNKRKQNNENKLGDVVKTYKSQTQNNTNIQIDPHIIIDNIETELEKIFKIQKENMSLKLKGKISDINNKLEEIHGKFIKMNDRNTLIKKLTNETGISTRDILRHKYDSAIQIRDQMKNNYSKTNELFLEKKRKYKKI